MGEGQGHKAECQRICDLSMWLSRILEVKDSEDNVADIFTKNVGSELHQKHAEKLVMEITVNEPKTEMTSESGRKGVRGLPAPDAVALAMDEAYAWASTGLSGADDANWWFPGGSGLYPSS